MPPTRRNLNIALVSGFAAALCVGAGAKKMISSLSCRPAAEAVGLLSPAGEICPAVSSSARMAYGLPLLVEVGAKAGEQVDCKSTDTPRLVNAGRGSLVGAGDWRQASVDSRATPNRSAESLVNAGAASAKTGSPDRLLSALRDTESLGSDVSKPNRKGALGPYQFKRNTWNDHARGVPWAQAVDEPTARVVAVRYLAWLDRTITKWSGKPATLDQVLSAWNGGIGTLRSVGFDPAAMPYEESRAFPGKVKRAMEEQR